jgi:hypothetical protein
MAFHPVDDAGRPTTPLEAVPPVPTVIVNAAVPLLTIVGVVPNPLVIVGAVLLASSVFVMKIPVVTDKEVTTSGFALFIMPGAEL